MNAHNAPYVKLTPSVASTDIVAHLTHAAKPILNHREPILRWSWECSCGAHGSWFDVCADARAQREAHEASS